MGPKHSSKVKQTHVKQVEKFIVRLPIGLRDVIRIQAEKNHRSMNGEILVALEAHFKK